MASEEARAAKIKALRMEIEHAKKKKAEEAENETPIYKDPETGEEVPVHHEESHINAKLQGE